MKALVTGATGFIGRRLVFGLDRPRILSRDPGRTGGIPADCEPFAWDPARDPAPREVLAGADVVFHLAGEPVVGGRWTAEKKRRIRDSRILGTRNLVAGIAQIPPAERPKVLVSSSAVGYYGSRGDETLTEASAPGNDFLSQVCRDWEAEALKARELGLRVVTLRTGVALGTGSGALAKMLPPFRMGLGGRLADGRHWMSWIQIGDLVGLFLFAAQSDDLTGPVNAVSPNPVTNLDFTRALGKVLNRPAILPMPGFALRMIFGEAASVLLASARAMPEQAVRAGFRFRFEGIAEALGASV